MHTKSNLRQNSHSKDTVIDKRKTSATFVTRIWIVCEDECHKVIWNPHSHCSQQTVRLEKTCCKYMVLIVFWKVSSIQGYLWCFYHVTKHLCVFLRLCSYPPSENNWKWLYENFRERRSPDVLIAFSIRSAQPVYICLRNVTIKCNISLGPDSSLKIIEPHVVYFG